MSAPIHLPVTRAAEVPARRLRRVAIGAVAVASLGAVGGVLRNAHADSGAASAFVPVTPVRVLDTRDPVDLGLTGPFVSAGGQDLRLTGPIPTAGGVTEVVPAGATGVEMNVTVVAPSAAGFLSVRPADAPGAPSTSSLNVAAGDIVPNAVSVRLPTEGADAGTIELTFDAYGVSGPTTDVLVDVVGYYVEGGGGGAGPTGPAGPQGPAGPSGVAAVVTRTASFTFGTSNGSGDGGYALALCLTGERVVGGGHHITGKVGFNNQPNVIVLDSRPALADEGIVPNGGSAAGWYVEARRNNTNVSSTLVASVQCAAP